MGCFNSMMATRVGEATHPGPLTSLCVTNPTALVGKVQEILSLPYQFFMSKAVPPLKATALEDFSYRGEAIGTAIFSRIPCRSYRGSIPDIVWSTCRVNAAVLQLQCCEVLLVTVYEFPDNKTQEIRHLKNRVLASAFNLVSQQHLPYIVAADFNTPICDLQAFEFFKAEGCQEAFSFYERWKGIQLPPTCKQTTRNDTCIIHPFLIGMVQDIHIDRSKTFDSHDPMIINFNFPLKLPRCFSWVVPENLQDLEIITQNTEEPYDKKRHVIHQELQNIHNAKDGSRALQKWSQACEDAMDAALRVQHTLDPIKHPFKCMPVKYRGRCTFQTKQAFASNKKVKSDRMQLYEPPGEVFSAQSHAKVRQTRRLKSLQKGMKSVSAKLIADPSLNTVPFMNQFRSEWQKILHAKGYGKSWFHWMLSFEQVQVISTLYLRTMTLHCLFRSRNLMQMHVVVKKCAVGRKLLTSRCKQMQQKHSQQSHISV